MAWMWRIGSRADRWLAGAGVSASTHVSPRPSVRKEIKIVHNMIVYYYPFIQGCIPFSSEVRHEHPIHDLLNEMLSVYWRALIQHRSHVAVIAAQGAQKLADALEAKIADEPETIAKLQDRLLDLGGEIRIQVQQPDIGTTIREALEKDHSLQKNAREGLNAWAERAAAAHDATTRVLIEEVLRDEEEHMAWLDQEISLYHRLGEALYLSKRM